MRLFAVVLALSLFGCATYRDQLARSEQAYEKKEHDRALALLRDLERDFDRLSPPEQAEYAYLRGMADYDIGYRADARHWLAVAAAMDEHSPGMLTAEWKNRVQHALGDLNGIVWVQGVSGLPTQRGPNDPLRTSGP
jgi:hypothetical protein